MIAPVITFIPRSRDRLSEVAAVTAEAGQRLYFNGRALVAAPRKPGAAWTRVGHPHPRRSTT